jgi:hypothetical protein
VITMLGKRTAAISVACSVAALAAVVGGAGLPAQGMASSSTVDPANFTCAHDDTGIWGPLGSARHDNLTKSATVARVRPGQAVTYTLRWEYRDWKPGAKLTIRDCNDLDATADGKATAPHQDMGSDPADTSFTQPETPPTQTHNGQPVVTARITVTVPADAPAGGEFCDRTAVFGNPADHRHSPPNFDISKTVCLPLVAGATTTTQRSSPPTTEQRSSPPTTGGATSSTTSGPLPFTGPHTLPLLLSALCLLGLGWLSLLAARHRNP